jgi:hypothetical protein
MPRPSLTITIFALLAGTSVAGSDIGNEDAILTAADAAASSAFGWSVAIDGNLAAIGARGDDEISSDTGAVYLFDLASQSQVAKLTASDATFSDQLGYAVAISDSTVAVGCSGDDDNGGSSGSVYIFDPSTGNQTGKLLASDGAPGDRFGQAVALDGNTAVAGAPSAGNGAAYVFDLSTNQQLFKLTPISPVGGQEFGSAVAIRGDRIVVGAYSEQVDGLNQAGAAYVFDAQTGQQLFRFESNDPQTRDQFGWSVAINDQFIAIGARWDNQTFNRAGAVYIHDATTGAFLRRITPDDSADFDAFGTSVALEANTLVVGATQTALSGDGPGAVYTFDVATGDQLARFEASDGVSIDQLGHAVAISGNTILAGAPQRNSQTGAVYAFNTGATPCPGDVDSSGNVDLADLNIVLGNFGTTGPDGDADDSGTVDLGDLNLVLGAFGTPCP